MANIKLNRKLLNQIVEYMVSGGVYFWAGYLAFFICSHYFGFSLWWAKLLSNLFGWAINYMLQRYWVFKKPGLAKHQTQVTTRYAIITIADFLLDYLIVAGLAHFGLTPYLGQFVSAGFFTVWNYLWYRLWVFTNGTHPHVKPRKRKGKLAHTKPARKAAKPRGRK